nr:hypothetical protein [uncultured Roseibium sp.]
MKSNKEILGAEKPAPNRALVGGAGMLALLSASCCVLPIGLTIIGLGGSWLTLLESVVAYRFEVLAAVALVLGWGWYRVWLNWGCVQRHALTLTVFVASTFAFALAASAPIWESEVARGMWFLWLETR